MQEHTQQAAGLGLSIDHPAWMGPRIEATQMITGWFVFGHLSEFRQFGYNQSLFRQLGMVINAVKSVDFHQFDV